ncbi:unnamed protein product, partial [Rotaria magnacalcarata]
MIEFKSRYVRISIRIGLALTGITIVIVLGLIPLYIRKHSAGSSQNGIAAYPAVLYIWSGQDISVSNAADFVAVIDFNESSSTYGQILKIVP